MDLMQLLIRITADDKDAQSKISGVESKAKGLSTAFSTVGKVGATAFKAVTGAVAAVGGAAATATVAIGKQAVSAFANYEQLVGGVETLFKNSAPKVQEYAKNAYATAGLSANEYMEQATSFSASLIQSLGNDTTKAAEYADRAISDMSDNANKMGTSMGMIQNAYNGFAKQNYMMLDNLKLGYGGTKTEMERLISDASKMTEIQKELNLTVKDGDMGFANIINAISVVQKKMDIMGTTAKEAMFTIQGAANSTKAAWKNVITAIGGGGDLDEAFQGLTWALFGDGTKDENGIAGGLINRVVPQVEKAINNIGKFLDKAIPEIGAKVPRLLKSVVPTFTKAVTNLGKQIVKVLPDMFDLILDEGVPLALETVGEIFDSIIDSAPDFLKKVGDVGTKLVTTFADKITKSASKLTQSTTKIITTITNGLSKALPQLLPAATKMITTLATNLTSSSTLSPLLQSGLALVKSIGTGIVNSIPNLWEGAKNVVTNIGSFLIENAPEILSAGAELLSNVIGGMDVGKVVTDVVGVIGKLAEKFNENALDIASAGEALMGAIVDGLADAVDDLQAAAPEIIGALGDALENAGEALLKVGGRLAGKIWEGIKDRFMNPENHWSFFSDAFENVGDKLTEWKQSYLNNQLDSGMSVDQAKAIYDTLGSYLKATHAVREGFESATSDTGNKITKASETLNKAEDTLSKATDNRTAFSRQRVKAVEDEVNSYADNIRKIADKIDSDVQQKTTNISNELSNSVNNANQQVSQGLSTADAADEKFGKVKQSAETAAQSATQANETISNTFTELGTNVAEAISSGLLDGIKWDEMVSSAQETATGIQKAFAQLPPQIKAIFEQIKTHVRELHRFVKQQFEQMAKDAVNAWNNVPTGINTYFTQIRTNANTLATNINTIFSNLVNGGGGYPGMYQWGADLATFFTNGIQNNLPQVSATITMSATQNGQTTKGSTSTGTNKGLITSNTLRSSKYSTTYNSEDNTAQILELLNAYLPQLANMQVVTDTGVTVGALLPEIDSQLGDRYRVKGLGGA